MSRFLFILDISFDKGGPSVHLLQDIFRDALKRGHKVDVVLKRIDDSKPEMPEEFSNNPNFRYECISESEEKNFGFVKRYISEVKYAKKCYKIYSEWGKFDAVFLQSCTTTSFYCRLIKKIGCPIILNVQDIFPYNLKFSSQLPFSFVTFPIFRKLQNLGYMMSDKIVTISDDMKELLMYDGMCEDKIDVIYNWSYADDKILKDKICVENWFELNTNQNDLNVVYAGNIGKMQNVEILARAAQLTKNESRIHYYIIGDGSNKKYVVNIVGDSKNVTFYPMQPSQYAESIYCQADIIIIPLCRGGIRTALPSKTATCLRTPATIYFLIDKESKFEQIFTGDDTVRFFDNTDPTELSKELRKRFEDKDNLCRMNRKVYSLFSRENAGKYIEIMEHCVTEG